ncbi:MAG: phosphopantetheine-binding protein [Rubrivivax sp.]
MSTAPTGPSRHIPDPAAVVDPRVDQILDVFAREAQVERSALRLDARADELGATSLDLALALFELEARFKVSLPEPAPGEPMPTVGEVVQQVLDAWPASPTTEVAA